MNVQPSRGCMSRSVLPLVRVLLIVDLLNDPVEQGFMEEQVVPGKNSLTEFACARG